MISKENPERLQNAALRTFYQLSMCQVLLTKRLFYVFELNKIWVWSLLQFEFSGFVAIQIEFFCHLSFVTNWVLSFYTIIFFLKVLSQFAFLNFHILSFWVLSQFALNTVTILVLLVKTVCCWKFKKKKNWGKKLVFNDKQSVQKNSFFFVKYMLVKTFFVVEKSIFVKKKIVYKNKFKDIFFCELFFCLVKQFVWC